MSAIAPELVSKRLEVLRDFRDALARWSKLAAADADHELTFAHVGHEEQVSPGRDDARAVVNRHMLAARQAVEDIGLPTIMVLYGPRVPIQVFSSNLFDDPDRPSSIVPAVLDLADQAIGAYEALRDQTGLVKIERRETIDVVDAIERALRPRFKEGPPTNEDAVQDAVEGILDAVGVRYTRDRETIVAGARATRPDFVLTDLDGALEVKLARRNHGASAVQEEIHADITAYKTRWKHLIFVIYDCGVIDDPHTVIRENQRLFGVRVVIVKH
jgi:hypothetical protein